MKRPAPSRIKTSTPIMISLPAQDDGASARFLERSIVKLFSSGSTRKLNLAQRGQDFFPCRCPCGEKSADSSHKQCKQNTCQHDLRTHAEIKRDLAKRDKAPDAGGYIV